MSQRAYYVTGSHEQGYTVQNGNRIVCRHESWGEATQAARRMAQQESKVLKIPTVVHVPDAYGVFQPEWAFGANF